MKKAAILTLNGYFNYGNRLQNYALQEFVKSIGFECETIINTTNIKKEIKINSCSKFKSFMNKDMFKKREVIANKIYNKLNSKSILHSKQQRENLFKKFSKDYIKETNFCISLNNIPCERLEQYDYFISGSDQVWNPNNEMVSEINFMTFVPKHKRLTYAPSFGVATIPEKYKKDYARWLEGLDNVSVREEEGANIIKELTGKEAVVLIDPTMILTKEKWLSISREHYNKPKRKYILTYFLGEMSKEVKNKLREISKKNSFEIVNLADIKHKKYYVTGPSEFIDYINDAELFITDSFHGCVFSVLLETPFVVCDRLGQGDNKMNSRINTFLNKFKLQSRKFNEVTDKTLFEKNYIETNKILAYEREKAHNYLVQVLRI